VLVALARLSPSDLDHSRPVRRVPFAGRPPSGALARSLA
jgi:hypothetical protein